MTELPNESTWPQALAEALLGWAQQLNPALAEPGNPIADTLRRCVSQLEADRADGHVRLPLSVADAARLRASGLVEPDPTAPQGLPLVIDDANQLYLHRDHEHERALAARIARLRAAPPAAIAPQPLCRLFPALAEGELDAQALAVAQALRQRLTLISGGPGTGKTSTVLRLLVCVLAAQPSARIGLAAPTGKAAQRMLEALRDGLPRLPAELAAGLDARLPAEALTLHRLLGANGQGGFAHGPENPLPLDWLIVDEASMLDLALARQLLHALPEGQEGGDGADGARLVLLGDRHQLAAVENGAVFAELSEQPGWREPTRLALQQALGLPALPPQPSPLPDLAVQFTRSHRFAADSGIGRLAACVRDGDADGALQGLAAGHADLDWQPLPEPASELSTVVSRAWTTGFAPYAAALVALWQAPGDPERQSAVWAAWERFRVLCAGHAGPLGSLAVNPAVARWLAQQLPADAPPDLGQALLVTRNQGAWVNGDIVLLLPDADGRLQAVVRRGSTPEALPVSSLPEDLAGAYALTVHKAQGSEFERCLLLLPALSWTSREWLTTGLTRARRHLQLIASEAAVHATIARPTARRSGLRDAVLRAEAESAAAGR